ncbi:hypothetical protein SAMN05216228_1028104 [Rhizobium tibeticum]|uniref:Uncharacterized protein n=1 Tax=Rhizobium tibeticum TaxID=501024 RepID=A0A1H8TFV3_9HYPH|nr:hypothetical protein [Rhizobium tibeticum]SEI15074.1 hypothetical protein RTCCBAU85039_5204 [Rhizobium tibeticum]SEO89960.1 hypothetical protein SAMN05216228_1028104 [Rhizobium tibeticum]
MSVSKIDEVFPIDDISEKIPSAQFTALGMKNLPEIIRLKGMTMFELGLTAWHAAMISGQFQVAPNSLGDLVDRREPNLLKYVSRALNRKMVFDISYQFATVPSVPTAEPKIQLLIAHLFPNRLHIADVQLLNPESVRAHSKADDDQSHNSLRLFGGLLAKAERVAKDIGAEKITLTSANSPLVSTFKRYGFAVEDSGMARQAMSVGFGIPMELVV